MVVCTCGRVPVASAQAIPDGGTVLTNVADVATLGGFRAGSTAGGAVASRTLVDVAGQTFTQAARIDVMRPTGQFWDSALYAGSNRAVAVNDVVLIHFYMRAVQTTDETGAVFCQLYAEGPGPSYTKSVSQVVSAGPEWVEYFVPFQVAEAAGSGQFVLNFGLGAATRPQVLEIAGAQMIWYGTSRTLAEMPRTSFRYEGRELAAAWRRDAARRIEEYRKGEYTVRVVNADGLPVPDAQVRVKLRRHAFHFASAWVASRIMNQANADNQAYRARLLELFNAGSTENDLKWAPWIGDWGAGFGRTQTLAALDWMKNQAGFHLRGHVLVWPSIRNTPTSIANLISASDPTVPQRVLDHIADEVGATKDLVPEWDVLNEPYDNHDIMDRYGSAVMVDWFKEAREHHATARLYINDYAILSGGGLNVTKQDAYAATIRYLLDNGAPIDGVGFQGHFDAGPTGMSRVWSIMQRYATEFPDLEFKITEFDVDSDDEALQADYLRDLLTLSFSHPKFTGFQNWGFWEGAHWRKRAAMVRQDWTEKPAAAVWRDLVLGQWQTDETRTSGLDGRVRGRGFLGDYDVTVTVGGRNVAATAVLDADGVVSDVVVNVPVDGAPRITAQPTGAIVSPGEPVTLRFEAAASPAPTLTWYKDGVALSGTSPTLAIASAAAGDEATYYAEAVSAAGTARTRSVKVGVRAPAERSEKLVNISTRGKVLSGSAVMIAGFYIEGGDKDVLLRGIGPRLTAFDVPGALADPRLELFRSSDNVSIGANLDWDPALVPVFSQVSAFGLGTDTRSAALRMTLPPGGYTVQLGSEDGGTGVALVEAYDVGLGEPLKLVNISTRGFVGEGDEMLIAGFYVRGSVPQRVLVRGVGPRLAAFGVAGTLADPRVRVIEAVPGEPGVTRTIASNDDWCVGNERATVAAAATKVSAFGLEPYSRDACLLLDLEPGGYTVQLSGAPGGTGIALVEVYAVP